MCGLLSFIKTFLTADILTCHFQNICSNISLFEHFFIQIFEVLIQSSVSTGTLTQHLIHNADKTQIAP